MSSKFDVLVYVNDIIYVNELNQGVLVFVFQRQSGVLLLQSFLSEDRISREKNKAIVQVKCLR